jgi:hypothetical protein
LKKLKIKIDRSIVLLVLCEWKNWSLAPKEEHTYRMFENDVLSRNFKVRNRKKQENGENWIMRNFIIYTFSSNTTKVIISRRMTSTEHTASMRDMRNAYKNFSWETCN